MDKKGIFKEIKSIGTNAHKGNIVGIQPFMNPDDYVTESGFKRALDLYLSAAKKNGFIVDKTIVVFPEYIGAWLLFAGEKPELVKSRSINDAIKLLITKYPKEFSGNLSLSNERDKIPAAIFRMKSNTITDIYRRSFSEMAAKYHISIIAGTIVVSNPIIENGILKSRNGSLNNISVIFQPDGTLYPYLVKKIYPVPSEVGFTTPGSIEELSTITTPIGQIGILICGDSWYSDPYKKFRKDSVDYIVVPSYQSKNGLWEKPWKGYPGYASVTYNTSDIGTITEGTAWEKYALAAKIRQSNAKAGINVFLKGNFWDMGADSGHSMVIQGSKRAEISTPFAGLVNIWLS